MKASKVVEIDLPIATPPSPHDAVKLYTRANVCVRAEVLTIAPHLAHVASFAVHADVNDLGRWAVSNIETGMSVCSGHIEKNWAIDWADRRLSEKSADETQQAIEANMAMNVRLA